MDVQVGPEAYPIRTSEDRPKIYDGIAQEAFSPGMYILTLSYYQYWFIVFTEISNVLMAPIDPKDVEIKPDGLIYLPEIRYRRILNRAFGKSLKNYIHLYLSC